MSVPGSGTVEVEVDLPVAGERAWQAITDRALVEQWFGVLDAELRPGAQVRLDFEDGDFFDLGVERVEPPRELAFRWRFMGTGPVNAIVLSVGGVGERSTVRVRDTDEERSREETEGLGEGWRDFLGRLGHWAATGERARYPLRSELDVTIELPSVAGEAWASLVGANGEAPWLPFEDGRLVDGAAVVPPFAGVPRSTVGGLEVDPSGGSRFELGGPELAPPLRCEIAVSPRGRRSELVIHQAGWADLDAPEADRRAWRRGYARLWIEAAQTAAQHVRQSAGVAAPL